jgi:hypothetical protein
MTPLVLLSYLINLEFSFRTFYIPEKVASILSIQVAILSSIILHVFQFAGVFVPLQDASLFLPTLK